ncbi:MAG: ATP-binding cassette domain-containing protein [Pyrinomonadaceae bacterium]|nr:ATP-binding cassette domain-containing protein [Pyrinomonadaceae bacterium]
MDRFVAEKPAAVECSGLSLERGGRLLFSDMTWSLPRGSFLAVTGPSGAGKSSLLACLNGNVPAAAGSVNLGGLGGTAVGTVFQHLRLTNELSVLTNVLCGRLGQYRWWQTLAGFGREDREAAFEILGELGLGGLVHKPVRDISGGEQQRTAIARVLFQSPTLILADEPTSNLDHALADQVLIRFRSLCKEQGCTVISVLHDRDLVERYADVELKIGEPVEKGWSMREVNAG